jgi:hypothetical protein
MPGFSEKTVMAALPQSVKMTPVAADLFESVGYRPQTRQWYVKFRNSPPLCFDNVPGFRYESLLMAPREHAYYRTCIKDRFLTTPLEFPQT